jgi:hypothetical protein
MKLESTNMQELEKREFTHDRKTFVLRLFGTRTGFSVVAFLADKQVSPSYSVDFATHTDYFMQHKESLTETLFGTARSDIETGMYFRP